ncbi:MAG: nucleotidyltransferase domain-containing protein [Spirochaetaceae bacterium]
MRVSKRIIKTLVNAINTYFDDVNIYLFGSRVDDSKRGGDIDIAIDTNISSAEFKKKRIEVITYLAIRDFDLKVDFVQYHSSDSLLSTEVENSSVLLKL